MVSLNSLLLVLLVVLAGVPHSEFLLATVGVVVLVSATPVSGSYGRRVERETLAEERKCTAGGLFGHPAGEVTHAAPEDLHRMLGEPEPPRRTRRAFPAQLRTRWPPESGR